MNVPDQTTHQVRDWLRRSTPVAPDAERSVDQVMATLFQQTQLRPHSSFRLMRGRSWGDGGFSMFSALKLGVATAVIALVGGLLAISALPDPQADQVPAAATESASPEVAIEDLPPYAAVTGKMWPGSNTYGPDRDSDFAGPGALWRDWAWDLRMEVDDPRLNGLFMTNQNYLLFDDSDNAYGSSGSLRTTIGTLKNEGGSWSQAGYGFSKPGSSSYSSNNYVLFLTGEGGYEGLTAMLLMVPAGSYWQLDGVIAPGPFPEPPATLDPAAAG
jgi:hypothetical protein